MTSISLALFQPDIPQNVGAAMRLCSCFGIQLHIIEPCGFPWDERKIRKAGMDYVDTVDLKRHKSWEEFRKRKNGRLILMTTKGASPYHKFTFQGGDILLAGRESEGVPEEIHNIADARIVIPMRTGQRSFNIINASAMVLGEALRQTNGFSGAF